MKFWVEGASFVDFCVGSSQRQKETCSIKIYPSCLVDGKRKLRSELVMSKRGFGWRF